LLKLHFSVVVMDRCIAELIESSLAVFIKEQMEAEYVQLAESKCAYASTISSLENYLAKCHSTIDKLSLQVKQLLIPFRSEEALYNDEQVSLLAGLPNFKVLSHVVATLPVEGTAKLTN